MTDQSPPAAPEPTALATPAPIAQPIVDFRSVIVVCLFALIAYIVYLIAHNPGLQDNKLFYGVAIALTGTGALGVVFGYYFVDSKHRMEGK